jgi:fucose permease
VRTARPIRARCAVSTIFFVNGVVIASWVPHVPAVKGRHGLTDGDLGLVLLSLAAGAVLALPAAGWMNRRLGSRTMTAVAAIALCVALPLPLLSPTVTVLCLSLALLGACNGTLDVSMNAQAGLVEADYGRPIMSSFHGLFSLGGLAGAGLASVAMWLGVRDSRHVGVTAIATASIVGCVLPWLAAPRTAQEVTRHVVGRPTRTLLGLGLLAFLALLAEGAMADWSAVYLRDGLRASPALAATGFAAFSLAMTIGRLTGDRLARSLGPDIVLRVSGATAALGLAAALLVGEPAAGIAGCGAVGLGIANIIPLLFSGAVRVGGEAAATSLATVATTGYVGFLAGPPVIGFVADLVGLPGALGIVSGCCGLVALGGGMLSGTGCGHCSSR